MANARAQTSRPVRSIADYHWILTGAITYIVLFVGGAFFAGGLWLSADLPSPSLQLQGLSFGERLMVLAVFRCFHVHALVFAGTLISVYILHRGRTNRGRARVITSCHFAAAGVLALAHIAIAYRASQVVFVQGTAVTYSFDSMPPIAAIHVALLLPVLLMFTGVWLAPHRVPQSCRQCGYDLKGLPSDLLCPECGAHQR